MFSSIPLRVIQESRGKVMPVLLEEMTGVSAKTWRKGGPKSKAVVAKADAGIRESMVRNLRDAGYSSAEIVEIYNSIEWKDLGAWQGLVKMGDGMNESRQCTITLMLAKKIDALGFELKSLRKQNDLEGYKSALLASDFFTHCTTWPSMSKEAAVAQEKALTAEKWSDIQDLTSCVAIVAIYQLLSHWDVEFLSKYLTNHTTGRGLEPRPLFELVMPAMKASFKQKEDGTYPFRGVFILPLARLLDFSYCLSEFIRSSKWPQKRQITRRQVASAGGEILLGEDATEQPLAKIRKGIRGLSIEEFGTVFQSMCGSDESGKSFFPPLPIYLAAQLWMHLYVKKRSGRMAGIDEMTYGFESDYRYCWDQALIELKAKGVHFGKIPWPSYLVSQ